MTSLFSSFPLTSSCGLYSAGSLEFGSPRNVLEARVISSVS